MKGIIEFRLCREFYRFRDMVRLKFCFLIILILVILNFYEDNGKGNFFNFRFFILKIII